MKTVPPNVELLALAEALESVMPRWVILPQASRLTSTAWNGAARSTTSDTLIDMSETFGTPANIDALLLQVALRDSGSAAGFPYIRFDSSPISSTSPIFRIYAVPNDVLRDQQITVPTNANGDIYFSCQATGTNTLDVWVYVIGYHLR